MGLVDVCDCGRVIQHPATGRRRTKCYVCRPYRDRRKAKAAKVTQLPVKEIDSGEGLTGATRRALEEWNMLDRWEGVVCIRLAELIDSGRMGASGPAGAVKSHRESMAFALQQSDTGDADIIDLLFSSAD
jgi:hypothetical protein